jgi:glyoxylase-like metal-dependent hydrolase (beta-lactamase superfamily II)
MSVVVDNEIAIVGDAMFGIFPGSVFPPYASDVKQMIASWGVLLKTDCSLFLPAHGSANSRFLLQKDYDKRKLKISATSVHTV